MVSAPMTSAPRRRGLQTSLCGHEREEAVVETVEGLDAPWRGPVGPISLGHKLHAVLAQQLDNSCCHCLVAK